MTTREVIKQPFVEDFYKTICELAYSKKPYSYAEHQSTFRPAYLYLIGYFRGASIATCDGLEYATYMSCLTKVYSLDAVYQMKRYVQEAQEQFNRYMSDTFNS